MKVGQAKGSRDFESGLNPVSELSSNQVQTQVDGERLELEKVLLGLSGNPFRVFNYLAENMIMKKVGSFETTYYSMSQSLGIPVESIKTVFKRLGKRGLLFSRALKGGGRGTKRTVGIMPEVMPVYLKIKDQNREELSWTKVVTKPSQEADQSHSIESRDCAPNMRVAKEVPGDWLEISIPAALKEIGFGTSHIKQLFRVGTLNPTEIQESLEAFSYDLEMGEIECHGPLLGFLMGILKESGSYVSEPMLTELKTQVEANHHRKKQMASFKRKQAEERLTKKAQEMIEYMTDKEKLSICPESAIVKLGTSVYDQLLLINLVEELQHNGD